ncbi:MAG: PH domain-containing protein [Verrucomicrobiota bacterium]|nr:PH domain-containing protein [Verrucomicrobiota bacterium]
MDLYVYLNGERRGPFPEHRVRSYLADGFLQPNDLAGQQREGEWKPLSTFLSSQAVEPAPAPSKAEPVPVLAADPAIERIANDSLGSYARSTITANETPHYKTSVHWIIFARYAVLGLLVFFFVAIPFGIAVQTFTSSHLGWFALPFPMFILVPPTLIYASSELVITSSRVLIKTGYFHRQTREMFVSKIESVSVDQRVLGRMLDYGTVIIRGTGGSEEMFDTIAHPIAFRNSVQQLQTSSLR